MQFKTEETQHPGFSDHVANFKGWKPFFIIGCFKLLNKYQSVNLCFTFSYRHQYLFLLERNSFAFYNSYSHYFIYNLFT